ncbi:MAG: biopolymer transporter ExbD, partial [Pseudomonadota bacterium]|nr:biopolymer transporter ExbD [Pseudomonadota bacterium]
MARRTARKRVIAEINIVPYIDVMLVLLVIFMITAPLLNQGVEIDLPQADANPLPPGDQQPLVVTVDHNGAYYLNLADDPS